MTARDDEQLDPFARDRSFRRLTPPVVNRRGATCDACGSDRPRVLHALRDRATGRHAFVGPSCLEALAGRGAVLRRPQRARTEHAYQAELSERQHRPPAAPPDAAPASDEAIAAVAGPMLLVAIVRPAAWGALLDLLGADAGACLVVPLGEEPPSLVGAALPLDRIAEFAGRAAEVVPDR